MFFDKCKLLRVYDSSLPIRVYLISTSLLTLTSLTTLSTGRSDIYYIVKIFTFNIVFSSLMYLTLILDQKKDLNLIDFFKENPKNTKHAIYKFIFLNFSPNY